MLRIAVLGGDGTGPEVVAEGLKVGSRYEVVVAGDASAQDTKAMLGALMRRFIPSKVVLLRPTDEDSPEITRLAEFTKYLSSTDGKATAYVCRNYSCELPTTDTGKMLELLGEQ